MLLVKGTLLYVIPVIVYVLLIYIHIHIYMIHVSLSGIGGTMCVYICVYIFMRLY